MRISDWSSDVCCSDLLRRRARREPDAALRFVAAELQHQAARAGEVRDAATARPGREGLQRDAAQRWRSDPGRLPDAPVRRAVEGVRRDGRGRVVRADVPPAVRSEEHTSELQSLMRTSYAV